MNKIYNYQGQWKNLKDIERDLINKYNRSTCKKNKRLLYNEIINIELKLENLKK